MEEDAVGSELVGVGCALRSLDEGMCQDFVTFLTFSTATCAFGAFTYVSAQIW